ncbi:MAG: TadA family conjugal transfer-associated ATPase [Actinomycetota bacterium]|nr:TadA family conjugal transfer-associated ATPase [Actinomycetota bacterium]
MSALRRREPVFHPSAPPAPAERFATDGPTPPGGRRQTAARPAASREPSTFFPDDEQLLATVRSRVAAVAPEPGTPDGVPAARLVAEIRAAAAAQGRILGAGDLSAAVEQVRDHAWGLGPLRGLVEHPQVTDLLVNGDGSIWADSGRGLRPVAMAFSSPEEVRLLATRLAAACGQRLDESRPWVDARLPGGIRLHAVVPPAAPEGTHVSLRILRPGRFDLDHLVRSGALPGIWAEVLVRVIERKLSFLVTGGTGAGKTTLLAALLGKVASHERIVLVEDVAELCPAHPHVVRLEARHANVEGRGEIRLDELVRQALRMRPDRLVVGECRGSEVRELLSALNTGQEGGCGTLHANAATEVPARLQALGGLGGMPPASVRLQAAAALEAVIHLRRLPGGARQVCEVATVCRGDGEEFRILPALSVSDSEVPGEHSAAPGEQGPSGRAAAEGSPSGSWEEFEAGSAARPRTGPGWPALARRLGCSAGDLP